jgi:predicted DNA-binding transcriptional regulator AlpA
MNSKIENDKLLTPQETCQMLGLTNRDTLSVWRSTQRYNLPFVKIGRVVRYKQSDVIAFVRAHTHGREKSHDC